MMVKMFLDCCEGKQVTAVFCNLQTAHIHKGLFNGMANHLGKPLGFREPHFISVHSKPRLASEEGIVYVDNSVTDREQVW